MTASPPTKVACRVATIGQGHANKFLQQWQQLHLLRSSSHRVVASQAQIFNLTTWPLQNRPIKRISTASGRRKTRRGGATTPPSMTKNKTKGKQRKKQQNNNNTSNNNNNRNLVVALDSGWVPQPCIEQRKWTCSLPQTTIAPIRTEPIAPNWTETFNFGFSLSRQRLVRFRTPKR